MTGIFRRAAALAVVLALSALLRQKEPFPESQVKKIKKDARIVRGSDVKTSCLRTGRRAADPQRHFL